LEVGGALRLRLEAKDRLQIADWKPAKLTQPAKPANRVLVRKSFGEK
jgi:hypothetical protein